MAAAGERFAAAAVGSSQFFGVLLPGAEAVPGGHGGHVRRAAAQVQDHGRGDAPAQSRRGCARTALLGSYRIRAQQELSLE